MHSAVAIARDLIAIPSVNAMGASVVDGIHSERQVALYVQSFFASQRIDAQLMGADAAHPNVVAHIDIGAPETILLEAHMDTVSHENMTIDPFDPVVKEDCLYGRGSCDTKSSLAAYLFAIAEIFRTGQKLARNVVIAGVHDEEFSFGGSRELVKEGIEATFGIVGEPTSLNIVHAHKGVCRFRLTTKGESAHAALPWLGKNAIYEMAQVLEKLEAHGEALRGSPHPLLGPATINVGRISGGDAVNCVPARCTVELDCRLLPGETAASVRTALKTRLKDHWERLSCEPMSLEAPAVYSPQDSLPCAAIWAACHRAGSQTSFQTAHYATDASIISHRGIPAVVFGPGSIGLAHTRAEFVPVEEIERAANIIISLLVDE